MEKKSYQELFAYKVNCKCGTENIIFSENEDTQQNDAITVYCICKKCGRVVKFLLPKEKIENELNEYKKKTIFSDELLWIVEYFDELNIRYLLDANDLTFQFSCYNEQIENDVRAIAKSNYLTGIFDVDFYIKDIFDTGEKTLFMKLERKLK